MKHAALFNGIGGFQLAAAWMGWENVWHCEIDPFCNKVVKYHFPNSICYEDIRELDATQWRGKIDIISGGFPCQPFSHAGKRKGTDDNRYLWPQMCRIIREVQPRYIVGENVSGLVNWDGGMVFEQVQADLEAAGYESQAYVLPACGVNAPHRRDRIWFIAHSTLQRERSRSEEQRKNDSSGQQLEGTEQGRNCYYDGESRIVTDTNDGQCNKQDRKIQARWNTVDGSNNGFASNTERIGQQGQGRPERSSDTTAYRDWKASWSYDDGRWPTESPVRGRNDGFPLGLAGITFSKWRQESIRALGNAVVPALVYEIFKAIERTDQSQNNN
jgi:DNA (cytosine-5)-methyltransferase 1